MQARNIEYHNTLSKRLPLDQQRFNHLLAPDQILNKLERLFAKELYEHLKYECEIGDLKFKDILFVFEYIQDHDPDSTFKVISEIHVMVQSQSRLKKPIDILETKGDEEQNKILSGFRIAINPRLNGFKRYDFVWDDDDFEIDKYGYNDWFDHQNDNDYYFDGKETDSEDEMLDINDPYIQEQIDEILNHYSDLVDEKMGSIFKLEFLDERLDAPTDALYLYAPYSAQFYKDY